jgi:hypothetical protein
MVHALAAVAAARLLVPISGQVVRPVIAEGAVDTALPALLAKLLPLENPAQYEPAVQASGVVPEAAR